MAIQIEIILESSTEIRAAYYYPVPLPQQLPGAVDPTRVPAGVALSPTEVQKLKDGEITEYVVIEQMATLDTGARRSKLVNEWAKTRGTALQKYKSDYSTAGAYFDGGWTDP
jgi:hypothetical protein